VRRPTVFPPPAGELAPLRPYTLCGGDLRAAQRRWRISQPRTRDRSCAGLIGFTMQSVPPQTHTKPGSTTRCRPAWCSAPPTLDRRAPKLLAWG
jgi:hypothetical protein